MSARVFNALGASDLERTICADAGSSWASMATHGVSPEVDPERWPQARYVLLLGLEPDVDRAAPVAAAARRRGGRARSSWSSIPFRSRTARVADEHLRPLPGTDAALALGMMRALRRRRAASTSRGAGAHTSGFDDLLARLDEYPVERCAEA